MTDLVAKSLKYNAGGFKLRIDNFYAQPSRINLLIGPNGAGKSSLLKILAGIINPSEGEILIGGKKSTEFSPFERAKFVSFVPQDDEIYGNSRVFDLIGLGRLPFIQTGETSPRIDKDLIVKTAAKLGCESLLKRDYKTLSGGEKRLIRLACALVSEPKIVLIDEPFNHLDIKHQANFVAILNQLALAGMNIIAVVHDINLAMNWDCEVNLMKSGKIIASGEANQILCGENLRTAYDIEVNIQTINGNSFFTLKV